MIDSWAWRLFVHCDRVEQHFAQIDIMGINNIDNNIWRYMWIDFI